METQQSTTVSRILLSSTGNAAGNYLQEDPSGNQESEVDDGVSLETLSERSMNTNENLIAGSLSLPA